jgi:CubicO group peptidase (beta-lactamase class C family)
MVARALASVLALEARLVELYAQLLSVLQLQALVGSLVQRVAGALDVTCVDQHASCCAWASERECASNRKYMLESCPAACGLCKQTVNHAVSNQTVSNQTVSNQTVSNQTVSCRPEDRPCFDEDEAHCEEWARAGECLANRGFMHTACRLSCQLCTPALAQSVLSPSPTHPPQPTALAQRNTSAQRNASPLPTSVRERVPAAPAAEVAVEGRVRISAAGVATAATAQPPRGASDGQLVNSSSSSGSSAGTSSGSSSSSSAGSGSSMGSGTGSSSSSSSDAAGGSTSNNSTTHRPPPSGTDLGGIIADTSTAHRPPRSGTELRYEFAPYGTPSTHALLLRRADRPGALRHRCAYDNWAYSLVDAIVEQATGRPMLWWVAELVLRPLRADDALACTGLATAADCDLSKRGRLPNGRRLRSTGCLSTRWCFGPARTEGADAAPLGPWPVWTPARPYTRVQVSNSMLGSVADMARLSRMLLNRGTLDGARVLSPHSVDLMLQSARDAARPVRLGGADESIPPSPTECMGMSAFGLGIGWCSDRAGSGGGGRGEGGDGASSASARVDDCKAADWYGWQGSFGSRFALMRTAGGDGIYCAQSSNIPNLMGRVGRVTSRHHRVAHNLTERMRAIWPPPAAGGNARLMLEMNHERR